MPRMRTSLGSNRAMDHIGMDAPKEESQICILTEAGQLIERRVRSEPRPAAVEGER